MNIARGHVGSLLLLLAGFLSGCAQSDRYVKHSGYERFFHPATATTYPKTKRVTVFSYSKTLHRQLLNQGFVLLGDSAFNGSIGKTEEAITFARKLGADVVLLQSRYTETEQGVIDVPIPANALTPAEAAALSSARVLHGNTSPPFFNGRRQAYSVERYDQTVLYFRRVRPTGKSDEPAGPTGDDGNRLKATEFNQLFGLYKKATLSLSQPERAEMDFLDRKSARYQELLEKALKSLPAEEEAIFKLLEDRANVNF